MAGPMELDTFGYTQMVLAGLRMVNMALPYANLIGADGAEFDEQFSGIVRAQRTRSQAIIDRENASVNQEQKAKEVAAANLKEFTQSATTNTKK